MNFFAGPHSHMNRYNVGLVRGNRVSARRNREPKGVVAEVGLMGNEALPMEEPCLNVVRRLSSWATAHISSAGN